MFLFSAIVYIGFICIVPGSIDYRQYLVKDFLMFQKESYRAKHWWHSKSLSASLLIKFHKMNNSFKMPSKCSIYSIICNTFQRFLSDEFIKDAKNIIKVHFVHTKRFKLLTWCTDFYLRIFVIWQVKKPRLLVAIFPNPASYPFRGIFSIRIYLNRSKVVFLLRFYRQF